MSNVRAKVCNFEVCKKKIMLSDFACRCSHYYCTQHRNPEIHACEFDYRDEGTKQLLKTMSTAILAKKVDII